MTDLVRGFGTEVGPRLWDFASAGVSLIRQAILDDHIDCDMQPHDALFVAATRSGAELIAAEFSARQSFGYPCQHYSQEQLPDIMASSAYYGALRFGGTFSIDGAVDARRHSAEEIAQMIKQRVDLLPQEGT